MLKFETTYSEALKLAPHLIAIGDTRVYLHNTDGFPWAKVTKIEAGGGRRFNGPCGFNAIVEEAGLELILGVDFEERSANGRGVSLFEGARLRDVAGQMSAAGRVKFGQFLADEVLPDLHKRTGEIRDALLQQEASENCVRSLIAFALIKP